MGFAEENPMAEFADCLNAPDLKEAEALIDELKSSSEARTVGR